MRPIDVFIITIMLCVTNTMAQITKAVVILKNGIRLEGFAKLNPWDNIKFRKGKGDKREHYTFEEVDTLKLFEDTDSPTYVQVKIKDKKKPKVLELVERGKNVSCYKDVMLGNMHQTFMPNGTVMITGFWGTMTYSYIRKTDEEEATYLASSAWVALNFRKNASEFFADCTSLVSKIQNRELKRADLEEIITYYNT